MPIKPPPRLERILLLAWTVALGWLVANKIGSIPPVLAWALVPYLALVARHLIAPTRVTSDPPCPAAAETPGVASPEGDATPPDPGPETLEPDPNPPPVERPSPARPRRRTRPRVVAEPAPAAWVQVAPGRFVRGEQPEPPNLPEVPEPTPTEAPEVGETPEVPSESTRQSAE